MSRILTLKPPLCTGYTYTTNNSHTGADNSLSVLAHSSSHTQSSSNLTCLSVQFEPMLNYSQHLDQCVGTQQIC